MSALCGIKVEIHLTDESFFWYEKLFTKKEMKYTEDWQ
jgi:hypothetical protein